MGDVLRGQGHNGPIALGVVDVLLKEFPRARAVCGGTVADLLGGAPVVYRAAPVYRYSQAYHQAPAYRAQPVYRQQYADDVTGSIEAEDEPQFAPAPPPPQEPPHRYAPRKTPPRPPVIAPRKPSVFESVSTSVSDFFVQ